MAALAAFPDGVGILYAVTVMSLLILAGEWLVMQSKGDSEDD